jgi:hypothetical protein
VTEITDERIAKLPRWAQRHIERLERDRDSLRAKLAQIDSGESPVVWDEYNLHGEGHHAIPARARVLFTLPSGGVIEVSLRSDHVEVRAERYGSIITQPTASNVLRIRDGEYWR